MFSRTRNTSPSRSDVFAMGSLINQPIPANTLRNPGGI
jgi:hypothetical protein